MQARWYSPGTATFRSRDTYAGDLNTPVTLNRYTYGANNPIRYWDPSGRNNCRTSSDICDGNVVDSQGKLVSTGSKAGSFNTDIVRGGNNNPSAHCIGKSDCRPMEAVASTSKSRPRPAASTRVLPVSDETIQLALELDTQGFDSFAASDFVTDSQLAELSILRYHSRVQASRACGLECPFSVTNQLEQERWSAYDTFRDVGGCNYVNGRDFGVQCTKDFDPDWSNIALGFGQTIFVAGAGTLAAGSCGATAGMTCVVLAGAGAGGLAQAGTGEAIDCLNAVCGEFSAGEFGRDFAGGAVVGGTAGYLAPITAAAGGSTRSTTGILGLVYELHKSGHAANKIAQVVTATVVGTGTERVVIFGVRRGSFLVSEAVLGSPG